MTKLGNIINIIVCCLSFCSHFVYAESFIDKTPLLTDKFLLSLNQNTNKTILNYGKLEGQVYVPNDVDPTTVVVQVGAVNEFNQTAQDFYAIPDSQGHFIFENTFTVGSSLNLIFWDRNGVLNKRALPVSVSKSANFYSVFLEKSTVTTNLAYAFGLNQDMTKAGLCGKIVGLTDVEILGSEVSLTENNTNNVYQSYYFDENYLPNLNQNYLSGNGEFCFFNVNSTTNSSLYTLHLKMNNGSYKSFFVYLPPYTFSTSINFDAKSALFKQVQMYSWQYEKSKYYDLTYKDDYINWHFTNGVYFTTTQDYSPILYDKESQNNGMYFPLGDEFLNINYGFKQSDSHFFIFQPRSALFSKKYLKTISDVKNGETFVDKTSPLVLKIFNPNMLIGKEYNKISPLFNKNMGSVFLNLDTSDYIFDKNYIKIYLKDISGNEVSTFYKIDSVKDKKEISGLFYNIPVGLFQVFVTVPKALSNCDNCTSYNSKEKLLWSSLVKSDENKTQVISNISDEKILIDSALSLKNRKKISFYNNDKKINNSLSIELIPSATVYSDSMIIQNYNLIPDLDFIKYHSVFYKYDLSKMCSVQESKEEDFQHPSSLKLSFQKNKDFNLKFNGSPPLLKANIFLDKKEGPGLNLNVNSVPIFMARGLNINLKYKQDFYIHQKEGKQKEIKQELDINNQNIKDKIKEMLSFSPKRPDIKIIEYDEYYNKIRPVIKKEAMSLTYFKRKFI